MPLQAISRYSEKGVVLLVFAVILLVGSTYLLTVSLNSSSNRFNRYEITYDYLKEAKQALIGFAVYHPDNPGLLPFPDRNGDGNYDGNSDCTAGAVSNSLLLGRIPWQGQGNPCIAPQTGLNIQSVDYSGQEIWYAVSKNLVYESPDYPFVSPAILNRNSDWITVRDQNANVLSNRVAFVVFSPGIALTGQDRSATAPAASNYLDSVTIGGTTYSNADTDQDYIIYPESDFTPDTADSFNDKLIYVTIDELMERIEKRAMNELTTVLTSYHSSQGAFPWLNNFSDPKTNQKRLTGEHSGANNQATLLTDSSADFTQWGVAVNDVVWNITDGSYGIVTAVASTTLTFSGGLSLGSDNDFDTDDEYFVDLTTYPTAFIGTATTTAGSSSLTLEDTTKDFNALAVQIGDIVELADGSSGVIESLTSTTLTVSSLTGATTAFANSLSYRIRTSVGRATANTDANGLTLDDTNVDFTVMGVQVGDLVRNITDGSYGRITAVAANRLTVSELILGTNNTFSNNDYYQLPRYNSNTNMRLGLSPIHELGEVFHTSFSVDWGAQAADGSTVTSTQPATDPKSDYADPSEGIKEWAERSRSNNSGTITVAESDGQCFWINSTVAECNGTFTDTTFLSGTATSVTTPEPADGNEYFYDTNMDFDDAGVYEGDKVENLTNGTIGLVDSATSTGIHFLSITGETGFSISTGDNYRISVATKRISNTADASTDTSIYRVYDGELNTDLTLVWSTSGTATTGTTGLTLIDSTANFTADENYEAGKLIYNFRVPSWYTIASVDSATQLTLNDTFGAGALIVGDTYRIIDTASTKFIVDDTVVENSSSDGQGLMTRHGYNWSNGGYFFEYTPLQGGSEDNIDPADTYRILYDYVDRREYDFSIRINSNSSVDGGYNEITSNGVRQRNVCLGYSADCSSASGSDTTLPGDSVTPMITIRDYNSGGDLVGDATVVIPNTGTPQGRVRVSGINLFLSEETDNLPAWFIRNKWYQYFYIAYSSGGDIPGTVTSCTVSVDCLTLNTDIPDNGSNVLGQSNVRALILYSDSSLTGQDRTDGLISSYFEGDPATGGVADENDNGDDVFFKSIHFNNADVLATDYNDRIRAAVSCPSSTDLCWQ